MPNKITIKPNGPFVVSGNIIIRNSQGNIILEDDEVYLCRCGHSTNKPFCDGSHKTCGFSDPANINDLKSEPLVNTEDILEITLRDKAMLLLKGPVTIENLSQTQSTTRNKVALCRCGKSNNKPFCDVSHKE